MIARASSTRRIRWTLKVSPHSSYFSSFIQSTWLIWRQILFVDNIIHTLQPHGYILKITALNEIRNTYSDCLHSVPQEIEFHIYKFALVIVHL